MERCCCDECGWSCPWLGRIVPPEESEGGTPPGVPGAVLEKACDPRLIGVIPTGGGTAIDTGGCGVGFSLPRDNDGCMEDEGGLLVDGSELCSIKFPRA